MDIKAKAAELIEQIKNDPALRAEFVKDPIKTVEKLIGIDLPDAQIKQIAELVKAKIGLDDLGSVLGGIGSLFGRK